MLVDMLSHICVESNHPSFSRDYSKGKDLSLLIVSPFRFRFLPFSSFAPCTFVGSFPIASFAPYLFLPPQGRLDGKERCELSSLQSKGLCVWATVADLAQASQFDHGTS